MFKSVRALQRVGNHLSRRQFIGLSVAAAIAAPTVRAALATDKRVLPQRFESRFSQQFERIKKTATKEELYAFLFSTPKAGDIHNHLAGDNIPEWWFEVGTNPKLNGGNEFYTRLELNDYCADCGEPLQYYNIRKSAYEQLSECCKSQYESLASLTPNKKQKWFDIHKQQLPSEKQKEWFSALVLDQPGEGRDEFFDVIFPRYGHLSETPEILAELLVKNMKRFGAEGVRYLETIHTPFDARDRDGNLVSPEAVDRLLRQRLNQPDAIATGVTVRFQLFVVRFLPDAEQRIEAGFKFIDAHRDLWVGINLVGREDNPNGQPQRFLETFDKMRQTYSSVQISLHAGEADEPNENVKTSLQLGATRIGHGVNLIADPETMAVMRDNQYLVEIQLISNQLLEYTPNLNKHPFPTYLNFGIPVCLNTDDRGIFDSNLTDEYYTAVTQFDLSWDVLVLMGQNSLKYSFLEPEVKSKLLSDYAARISEFEQKYANNRWRRTLAEIKPITSVYANKNFGII